MRDVTGRSRWLRKGEGAGGWRSFAPRRTTRRAPLSRRCTASAPRCAAALRGRVGDREEKLEKCLRFESTASALLSFPAETLAHVLLAGSGCSRPAVDMRTRAVQVRHGCLARGGVLKHVRRCWMRGAKHVPDGIAAANAECAQAAHWLLGWPFGLSG